MRPQAIIFDLDGLLIDSEPIWYEAEKTYFAEVGLLLSDDDCLATAGMRVDHITRYWYERHPWPAPPSTDELAIQINDYVIQSIRKRGVLLPGAQKAVKFARSLGVKVGLASASHYNLIFAAVDTFGLRPYFDVIHSSESELQTKPHPAVYLAAAKKLGVPPEACVAVEDSVNGMLAAKAAGMKCVVIPGNGLQGDSRFLQADLRLNSLEQFDELLWQKLTNEQ